MDDWTPEPELAVTDEWLAQENERLRLQEEAWRATPDVEESNEVVKGSRRSSDGRFKNLPDRVFRTDGAGPLPPDEYREALIRIREQARWEPVVSPAPALERARTVRRLCDALEYKAVAFARGFGWSWRDIGDAFGMTESGAHRRFAGELTARARRHRRS